MRSLPTAFKICSSPGLPLRLQMNRGVLNVPLRRRMAASPVRQVHEDTHQHHDGACHGPAGLAAVVSPASDVRVWDQHVRSPYARFMHRPFKRGKP